MKKPSPTSAPQNMATVSTHDKLAESEHSSQHDESYEPVVGPTVSCRVIRRPSCDCGGQVRTMTRPKTGDGTSEQIKKSVYINKIPQWLDTFDAIADKIEEYCEAMDEFNREEEVQLDQGECPACESKLIRCGRSQACCQSVVMAH